MFDVTDAFLRTIRQSHNAEIRVDMWRGGTLLKSDLAFTSGQVSINGGTGVRRDLDITLADRALWSEISIPGTELRPFRGVRYADGSTELVPLGVFLVDQVAASVGPDGGLQISSAPDRWSYVQRARFESPTSSVSTNMVKAEVARLILDAFSTGVDNTATSTALTGVLVYDRDREKAVSDFLMTIGAEAYFDVSGQLVICNAPKLSSSPVWEVDAGLAGILLSGSRRRDRSRTYNVVVVSVSVLDGQVPPAPVLVVDNDPTSPTYVGGAMGRVPYFYTSPVFLDTDAMTLAGQAILNRVKGLNAQLEIDSVVNPALDRGDVIQVKTSDKTIERHLVISTTIPLTVDGTQSLGTQSSRPDGDVPPEE